MDSEEQQRVDQKVMDCFGVYYKDLLVRVHNCGVTLAWSNEQILRWYETEGRKLQVKRQFRKLPAVMVYLLRRNDQSLLAGNERVMASTRQLEKTRSEELRRLRAEVEAFAFDKQNWAVQSTAMQRRIAELEQELARSQEYTEALEICCGKVGLPVSAIRQAGSAVASGDAQEDSDEEEVLSLYGKPRRQTVSFEEGPATPRGSAGPTPGTGTRSYYRPDEPGKPWQRSPVTPIDLKQYQKELWDEGGELVPHLKQDPLVIIAEEKQQVVLEQLRERLKILHAQAALKQQQADMRNEAQFNPTSEIKFTEVNSTALGIRRNLSEELSMTPREDVLKCPPLGQRGEL
ncbi:hypothetical protein SKAU_G00145910 [Synaphobranchus kaupii]|uniref:Uncharacterized protein n=1 Tax=Synaphobranchus kaupii TaxID=118154 RepID=A0A9Q1FU44_SYNKA|nr:hypothetical protein SKAU_G00145910 [Synaphobranchus kaupii]